ncbi:DUF1878 family protein [Ornithinibacillus scapharcae]|uniref:DUF1878 family protein n=1 Tax=Ornithinibacillus scapharcae TaxID=1147159 RepID=UPI000225B7AC|nr:DUF1878 family protein [Ornithinibacillus scapharcae]
MNNNEADNLATFQIQLLTNIIDIKKFPFTKLIMERRVTEKEYTELFEMLERLNMEYRQQKEEGLLDYSTHLMRFVGMLTEKLDPTETILALECEGYYPELLGEFIRLIHKNGL